MFFMLHSTVEIPISARFTKCLSTTPRIKAAFGVWAMHLLLYPCLSAQGPLDGYLKGKGVLDFAPSFSTMSARTFNGAQGQVYQEPFKGQMLGLFAEYGLSNNFDVVATAALVFTPAQTGLQDGGVFVKYRPLHTPLGKLGKLGIIAGLGATFPLSNYQPTVAGAIGQRAVTVPARFILQYETPFGLFLNLTAGRHWRLDQLRNEDIEAVRSLRPDYSPVAPAPFSTFLCKIGLPAKHYYLDAWVERQLTKGGNDYQPMLPDLPQAYGVSYWQFGGTAYYSETGKTGYFFSTGFITKGRNVSQVARITIGMILKFGASKA